MKIQTINQLVSVWKDIATRHYQINGFGVGDNWEVGVSEAYMHPVLWINPVTASMPSSDNGYKTFEIDFEVRLFDLVNKDESNENDVLSDTIDILKDIIAEFKGHPYYVNSQLNIIGDIDFEAFTEEFDEEVSGWSCDISLMTPVLTTFCGIPATDITGFEFPGVDCPEVNVLCPVFVEDVTGVYPIVVTTTGTTKEVSIVGGGLSDTFVISGNYNGTTENLELLRNDGVTVLTDLSSIGGGGVDTNTFLVSGVFDNSTNELELAMNDGTVIDVDLSALKDDTNTHLSTTDFNNNNDNTLVSTLNDGTVINTLIDNFDGLDVTGTVDATAFVGDGSGLTNLPSVGGDNLSNADLTQVDSVRTYTLPSGSNKFLDILGDTDNGLRILNDADIILKTSTDGTGVDSLRLVSIFNGSKIEFNNNFWKIHAFGNSNMLLGSTDGLKGNITLETGVVVRTPGTAGATSMSGPEIRFYDRGLTTQWAKFDVNGRFIFGSNSFVGSEKFSIQDEMLVKGSDTSVVTSGFKVTDVNNDSLLEVKNNGVINASKLPTSSTGLSSGDMWNNGGVLNIV